MPLYTLQHLEKFRFDTSPLAHTSRTYGMSSNSSTVASINWNFTFGFFVNCFLLSQLFLVMFKRAAAAATAIWGKKTVRDVKELFKLDIERREWDVPARAQEGERVKLWETEDIDWIKMRVLNLFVFCSPLTHSVCFHVCQWYDRGNIDSNLYFLACDNVDTSMRAAFNSPIVIFIIAF